jgi:hypothetical protein
MKRVVALALAKICFRCSRETIPRRIQGKVVGSSETLHIWQCRECKALWSDNE